MASLLNEPWIENLLLDELQAAALWKSSQTRARPAKVEKEHENAQSPCGSNRFADDGSNLVIRPQGDHASSRNAQIVKVTSENAGEVVLSDSSMTIKAKLSTASLVEFAKRKRCQFSRKHHGGGIIQIYDSELRATQLGPADGQVKIFVRDFQLLGSTGSQVFGRPSKAHESARVQNLLRRVFKLLGLQPGNLVDEQADEKAENQHRVDIRGRSPESLRSAPVSEDFHPQAPLSTQRQLERSTKSNGDVQVNGAVNLSGPQVATRKDDSECQDEKVVAQLKVSDAQVRSLHRLLGEARSKDQSSKSRQALRSTEGASRASTRGGKPNNIDLREEECNLQNQPPEPPKTMPHDIPNVDEALTLPDSRSSLFFESFEDLPINSKDIPPDQHAILFGKGSTDASWHRPDAGFHFPQGPNIPPRLIERLVNVARKRHARGFDFGFPTQWNRHFNATTEPEDVLQNSSPKPAIVATKDDQADKSSLASIDNDDEAASCHSTPISWSPTQRTEDENGSPLPPNSSWQGESSSPKSDQRASTRAPAFDRRPEHSHKAMVLPRGSESSSGDSSHEAARAHIEDHPHKLKNLPSYLNEAAEEASSPVLEITAPRVLNDSAGQYELEVGETPNDDGKITVFGSGDMQINGIQEQADNVSSSPPLSPQASNAQSSQSRKAVEINWSESLKLGQQPPVDSSSSKAKEIPKSEDDHGAAPQLIPNDRTVILASRNSPKSTAQLNKAISPYAVDIDNSRSHLTPRRRKRSSSSLSSPSMPIGTHKKQKVHGDLYLERANLGADDPAQRARLERLEFFQNARLLTGSEKHKRQPELRSMNLMAQPESTPEHESDQLPENPPQLINQVTSPQSPQQTFDILAGTRPLLQTREICSQIDLSNDFVEKGDDPITHETYFHKSNEQRLNNAFALNSQNITVPEAANLTALLKGSPPNQPKPFARLAGESDPNELSSSFSPVSLHPSVSSRHFSLGNQRKVREKKHQRDRDRALRLEENAPGLPPSSRPLWRNTLGTAGPSLEHEGYAADAHEISTTRLGKPAFANEISAPLSSGRFSPAGGDAPSAKLEAQPEFRHTFNNTDSATRQSTFSKNGAVAEPTEEMVSSPQPRHSSKIAELLRERNWWQDGKTPFKEWARAYAELKIINGTLGTTIGPRLLNVNRECVDVLAWKL